MFRWLRGNAPFPFCPNYSSQTGLSGLSAVYCWPVCNLLLSTEYGRSCLLRSRTFSEPKMGSGEAWMTVGGSREGAWENCGALGSPLGTQDGAQGAFWSPRGIPGGPPGDSRGAWGGHGSSPMTPEAPPRAPKGPRGSPRTPPTLPRASQECPGDPPGPPKAPLSKNL